MARRKRKGEDPPGRDPSRIMFLSLNMILLAFFILLVALSQPDKTKEAAIAIEVRKAFQSFGGAYLGLGRYVEQRGLSRDRNPLESSRQVEQFLGELSRYVEENDLAKRLSLEIRKEGMAIHIASDLTFPEGSARLRDEADPLLERIGALIRRTSNPVRVEGHTDNRELRTERYRDNFELSAARAMAVFRRLQAVSGAPAERFQVVGYGAERPIATNLTEEGRERNRRVTITLQGELKRAGGSEGSR